MSGDWIKMRACLDTHPKVLRLSSLLRLNVLTIVGMLWKVWTVADQHSVDGRQIDFDHATIDKLVGRKGFTSALASVGWAESSSGGLTFVNFEEHNGSTAKKRACDAARKASDRKMSDDSRTNVRSESDQRREEKRREENKDPSLPDGREGHAADAAISPDPPNGGNTPGEGDSGESPPSEVAKPKSRPKRVLFDPERVPLPYDSASFRESWGSWCRHRRQKRVALTEAAVELQMAKLREVGESRAIEILRHSTLHGYTGLFEPHARDSPKASERPDWGALVFGHKREAS